MASSTRDDAELSKSSMEELGRLRRRVAELERELSGARDNVQGYMALTEREALLRQVERDAQMGTWIWDVPRSEVYWSSELYRILGYDPELDTPSVEAFFAAIHPEDVERIRTASERAVATGDTPATEARILQRSGEVRYVLIAGVPLHDDQGKLARIVGTVLDLSDRRQAEQHLRRSELLLNEAQRMARVGSWTWDLGSQVLEGSGEFYRVLGEDAGGPVSIAAFLERVHPDDRARVKERLLGLASTAQEDSSEFRLHHRDGVTRRVLYSARPVFDPSGKLMGYVGTSMDVTERSQLEEQLRQAQKMEAVGRLAGGVAHDFNNLLTVILAYTELLSKQEPREELRAIETAATAAADLTRRLLTFSRRAVIQPVVLDLNEVIEGATLLLSRALGEDVRLQTSLDPALGSITADAGQAHQVLLNLAVNARDAMPNGGTLEIRTANVWLDVDFARKHNGCEPGPYVLLQVSDTGIGMDEHTQLHMFEPFFTTKSPEKGTGLGLSTVFGIVSQGGGAIEVDSALGKGSVFRLYFPREGKSRTLSSKPAPHTEAREVTGFVLVAEDSGQVAELVTRVLTSAGYAVLAASGFQDALRLWSEQGPNISLLLTDIVMPDGNGLELARRLRSERAELAVLYMSGYAPESATATGEPLDGLYLDKPFSARELLDRVGEALSGPG